MWRRFSDSQLEAPRHSNETHLDGTSQTEKKKSCVSTEPVANSVSMQRVINRGFEALVFPVSLFADTSFLVMENNRKSSVEKVFLGVNESFKLQRKVRLIPVQVDVYSNGSSSTSRRFSVIFETKEI